MSETQRPIQLTRKPEPRPSMGPAPGVGKTACIRTFGCQMNVHDSDRMRRMILDAGYSEVTRYEDADLVILNTCYVRENAVDRVRGHLGELTRLRREGRLKKVALTGCIGAAEESETLRRQFGIDLVLGTHNTYELAEFVGLPTMEETYTPELPGTEGEKSAFVTIMTGCNYKCSYCVVPSVRGRMVCRSKESILAEVDRLVEGGTGYVTLLGQTVDAWRHDGERFCDLLEAVAERVPRVSFTTSHPSNMEDRTLHAIGIRDTIVKRLHLPVQSGSDRMLGIMHRGYKAERYRRKIEIFRGAAPGGTLSTDLIVGHPGETEEDHEATLSLVEDCSFDSAYVFKFSPRAGTEAATLGDPVAPGVAQRRFVEILRAIEGNALTRNRRKIGAVEEVYVRHGANEDGRAIGETWTGHAVHLKTGADPGEYVRTMIESAGPHTGARTGSRVGTCLQALRATVSDRDVGATTADATADGRSKSIVAVCGPTASGKSGLSDDLADLLSGQRGVRTPVIVVDSMQVYSGIEIISNQARGRPAELTSIVPVTEKWTVSRHARAAEILVSASETGAVLDAGTGMYLNAVLLDIPITPKVPNTVREEAVRVSSGRANPRRASRALELEMVGAGPTGSIWDGGLRYSTTLLYLRPEREALDRRIAERSRRITANGVEEARGIRSLQEQGHVVNPSVIEAVGVRELLALVDGELTAQDAEDRISTRTRQLARKQLRWFDKLARTLEGRARVVVAKNPGEMEKSHTMHDIIKP